ncbi:hypothetical protein NP233_g2728 [Leucocoprinus birnbaumii]|uniref:Uncharacterized protein n=1 Tax=Leucocoprinus birnbaumii TaxID=56174 RepID=A0AAD5W433_9AGAR|nr:hypothetical protein NP233_g2728 [Leucocoprinus birnbaumii]
MTTIPQYPIKSSEAPMTVSPIARLITAAAGRRWLDAKDEFSMKGAWADLCSLASVNRQCRGVATPFIFGRLSFEAGDIAQPWHKGPDGLLISEMDGTSWWSHVQSVVLKCDAYAYQNNPNRNVFFAKCLGNIELARIIQNLYRAPYLQSIEIDFGQSSESRSQKLVPWKFFGKNKLIIESFIIWWIERKSATKLTVRCIKDFPHHLVNGAHCLYLDASTFDKDSVAARASPRTAFLSLYDCQQVLHLYKSRKILFNSLTSLFINVSNAKELDKVNWFMGHTSNTVSKVGLDFCNFDRHRFFLTRLRISAPFHRLRYLLIEFKSDHIGPVYRFLHPLRYNANNLKLLHLVAYGDTRYPGLNNAVKIVKDHWCLFQAIANHPDVFPSLEWLDLDLATQERKEMVQDAPDNLVVARPKRATRRTAQQAVGNPQDQGLSSSTPELFEFYKHELKNKRDIKLTFVQYYYT